MEPPKFYFYSKASGLVDETILDEILREFQSSDSKSKKNVDTTPIVCSLDLKNLQHQPRLRYVPFRKSLQAETEEDSVDNSNASLDGEAPTPHLVGTPALADAEADRRFADELVRRGILNHWQARQLLDGRTKFRLGDYRVLDAIGKGGYGHVFLGREEKNVRKSRAGQPIDPLEQFVALKVLPLAKATPELTERFLHEIDVQKDLQRDAVHPNLVRFIDSGRDGNVHFMVHEFIDGGDLRLLLVREEKLPIGLAAAIVAQIASGIQFMHDYGIVHRDIKPANVLLSGDGNAKLTDLGLSIAFERQLIVPKETESEESTVLEGQIDRATGIGGKIAGTIDYLAPDQIRNPTQPTPLWDIYSLGCTFYRMLTGVVPFSIGDPKQKLLARLRQDAKDPRIFNQAIPFDIAKLIREMLAKEPEKRISSAAEVAERLAPWTPPLGLAEQLVFGDSEPVIEEIPYQSFPHVDTPQRTVIVIP